MLDFWNNVWDVIITGRSAGMTIRLWWKQNIRNGKRRSLPHFLMWQPLRAAAAVHLLSLALYNVHLLSLATPFQSCQHNHQFYLCHHIVSSWDILHHFDFVLNIHILKASLFWMTISGALPYWLFVCDRCLLPAAVAGPRRSLVSGPSHAEAPRWP